MKVIRSLSSGDLNQVLEKLFKIREKPICTVTTRVLSLLSTEHRNG